MNHFNAREIKIRTQYTKATKCPEEWHSSYLNRHGYKARVLLRKLAVYHFSQHSIHLFKSYLRNRKQLVQNDNILSSFEVIKTGVPQVSQLGPLMFLLFINDLPLYLHHSSTDMYADDSTLYTSDISVSNLETILQKDLNRVLEWCYINKMNLNAQKTKCMLVVPSNKLSKFRDLNCDLCWVHFPE